MKAIYSFSGLPFKSLDGDRFTAGFKTKEDFLSCAKESIQGARLSFNKIELYTDESGEEVLKDLIPLFDKVIGVENQDKYSFFFAYVKLQAYKLQKDPFIHLDLDLVLRERLPESILKSEILVEFEEFYKYYKELGYQYLQNSKDPLKSVKEYFNKPVKNPYARCTGIFGGSNIDLIQSYVNDVLKATDEILEMKIPKDLKTALWLEQGLIEIKLKEFHVTPTQLFWEGINYIHYNGTKKLNYQTTPQQTPSP